MGRPVTVRHKRCRHLMRDGYLSTERGAFSGDPTFTPLLTYISGRNNQSLLRDSYSMPSTSDSVTSQQAVDNDLDVRMTRRVLWKLDCHILPPLALVSIQLFE